MLDASKRVTSVYVAVDERGWHKIGHTADPKLREYHLSRDRGCKVRLVHIEPPRSQAEHVEVTTHWLLSEHENGREWFNVNRETALAALRQAVAKVNNGHVPHSRFAYERRKVVRESLDARMRTALHPGESRQRFIDEAVERELERREAKQRAPDDKPSAQ